MKKLLLFTLIFALLTPLLAACSASKENNVHAPVLTAEQRSASDFSVRLLQESYDGKNVCVSPLSVYMALTLALTGAAGDTQQQIISALSGGDLRSAEAFLTDAGALHERLNGNELKIANSVWAKEKYKPLPAYQTKVQDVLHAEILPLTDADAVNRWVDEKTDGMIKKIVGPLDDSVAAILVNALSFESAWRSPYDEYQVRKEPFRNSDGTQAEVEMMHSAEGGYIKDANADGFVKLFRDGTFAFGVIVPHDGVSLDDYVAGLNGKLTGLLRQGLEEQNVEVRAAMPRFDFDFSIQLNDALRSMGITDAFDPGKADFSPMTEHGDELYVAQVLHKTHIEVGPQGAKAGAATAIMMENGAMPIEKKQVTVTADHPFLFVIFDRETCSPVFLGAVNHLG